MSSLGDLLLGKAAEPSPSPTNEAKTKPREAGDKRGDNLERRRWDDKGLNQPTRRNDINLEDSDEQTGGSQKVFPERIVKNKITKQEIDQDCRSNASSTDDYVRELLDPNDRPRNVWHVIEGPKRSSNDDREAGKREQRTELRRADDRSSTPRQRRRDHDDDDNGDRPKLMSPDDYEAHTNVSPKHHDDQHKAERISRDDTDDMERRETLDEEETAREGRISSSKRHHCREDRHGSTRNERSRHDRYRHRDPDRDKGHRSSRRRRDYSDEDEQEDEDDGQRRRHGSSRSSRHKSGHRRSRSRTDSKRRDRSRSNSQSPITKRNSRTVLVMQLSPRATSRELEDFFSDLGEVRECRLIMDSKTRRHKGIAYIEFEDASSANKALTLNGKKFLGVPMQIQSALLDKNKGDWHHQSSSSTSHHHHHQQQSHHHHSSNHAPSLSSSRSNLPPNSYRIYIGSLHVGITDEMLRTIVEPFGPVLRLELIKDRNTGVSRGYAFVLYANTEDGQEAVRNLDGFELAGKSLRVSKSAEKGEQPQHTQHHSYQH